MSLLRDMKLMSRQNIFVARQKCWLNWSFFMSHDIFECLRHNLLSLRQVSSMWRQKLDPFLFRSIAGTGDLLSKHALGILCFNKMYWFQFQCITLKNKELWWHYVLFLTNPKACKFCLASSILISVARKQICSSLHEQLDFSSLENYMQFQPLKFAHIL